MSQQLENLVSEVLGYREDTEAYLSFLTPVMCPTLLSRGIDMGRVPMPSLCTEKVSTVFKTTQQRVVRTFWSLPCTGHYRAGWVLLPHFRGLRIRGPAPPCHD